MTSTLKFKDTKVLFNSVIYLKVFLMGTFCFIALLLGI